MSTDSQNNDKSALIKEITSVQVKWTGYVALIGGIIFFTGFLSNAPSWAKWFDYVNLLGKYGKLSDIANNIQGVGGTGARNGFMQAMTAWPVATFSMAIINLIEGQGGLKAGQKLLNPILKPLLGIPGWTSLALVSGLCA